jgi:hypothetical protein
MNLDKASVTAFCDRVTAQLQEASARLQEFEASAKVSMAQGELDAIKELRAMKDAVSRRNDELKTAHADTVTQISWYIDSHLAALHAATDAFKKRLHSHATTNQRSSLPQTHR